MHRRSLVRHEVRPLDGSDLLSGEPDALRVLLAGSGITSGWGVSTHGLALVGAVQRTLQVRVARAVDVRQVSRVGAFLADAVDIAGAELLGSQDVLVLAFGWSDAFALTPVARWTETLDGVLDLVARGRRTRLPVVVVGLPPMDSLGIAGLLGPLVRRHGERLNEASRAVVAERTDTAFVPLAAAANRDQRPWGSPEAYAAWAAPIADAIASLVDALPGRSTDEHEDVRAASLPGDLRREAPTAPPSDPARGAAQRPSDAGRTAAAGPKRRRTTEALDAVRMRTGVRDYAMRVLDDLGHPPLVGPTGAPWRTLVPGSSPVRVLFFGGGLAVGYGVKTRDDAVDGSFAHALSEHLARGVVIENRAVQHLRLEQAVASLGTVGTFSYDVAVWYPSFIDGIERLRPSWWRSHLHSMVRELRDESAIPVLLTHMPIPAGLHPAALIARPWVRRLNRIIDQVAAEWDGVRSAATEPFFPAEIGQKVTDRAYFRAVSERILPAAAELLRSGDRQPNGASLPSPR